MKVHFVIFNKSAHTHYFISRSHLHIDYANQILANTGIKILEQYFPQDESQEFSHRNPFLRKTI